MIPALLSTIVALTVLASSAAIEPDPPRAPANAENERRVDRTSPPLVSELAAEEPAAIRAEALIVSVPTEHAVSWAERFKDPAKSEPAYRDLLVAIQEKKARLIAAPTVEGVPGNRMVLEDIREFRYASLFAGESFQKVLDPGGPEKAEALSPLAPPLVGAAPTAFETRNIGVTLEAEADAEGEIIDVHYAFAHVEVSGWFTIETKEDGKLIRQVAFPRFQSNRVKTKTQCRSGERILSGVFQSAADPHSKELFLVRWTVRFHARN